MKKQPKEYNLFTKMDNLRKRHMKYYFNDLEIDKQHIVRGGEGTYYLLVREAGSECASIDEYENKHEYRSRFDYFGKDKTANFYIMNVNRFENGCPYGSIKKVKSLG